MDRQVYSYYTLIIIRKMAGIKPQLVLWGYAKIKINK